MQTVWLRPIDETVVLTSRRYSIVLGSLDELWQNYIRGHRLKALELGTAKKVVVSMLGIYFLYIFRIGIAQINARK